MERLTGWRRIAAATWHGPDDPQIYGSIELDATGLLAAVEAARSSGVHVTVTHFVGRAVAFAMERVPEVNVRIVAGYAVPRRSIDIFFINAVSGGRDLSGVKVERANEKSVVEVARELERRGADQKRGRDPDLAKSKRIMDRLPIRLLRAALRASVFIASDLDRDIRALSLRASPFGSAMVTSVGMFGLPMGFAPIAWMYRVPILVLVGEIADKPVAVDGAVVVRKVVPICATIDHRYVDAWHISRLLDALKAYLADPRSHEV